MTLHFIRGIVVGAAGIGLFGAACTYEPPAASNTGGEGGKGTGGNASTSGSGGKAGAGGSGEASSSSSGSAGAGGGTPADWWDQKWLHRVKISFKNGGGESLSSFPVLVKLNEKVATNISASNAGVDVRFIDADGKQLVHEIDGWNAAGESLVWVNVPTIDATDTDYIWLYYGNSAAGEEQKASAVWSGFTAVYHLSEPNAPITNSVGGMQGQWKSTAGTATAGIIGPAIQFNGVGFLQLAENSIVDVGLDQARTIEAWAHPDIAAQHQAIVWEEGQCVGWSLKTNFMGQFEGRFITDQEPPVCMAGAVEVFVTSKFSVGGWHYLSLVIDRPGMAMSLYVDGQIKETKSIDNIGLSDGNGYFQIGGGFMGSVFVGAIDEVRISNQAQTPGWIAAQHKSMTNQFLLFSMPESL